MHLIKGNDIISDFTNLELIAYDTPYLSSTILSRGQWYFEFEVTKPISYRYAIGITNTESGLITLNPRGNNEELSIYINGNLMFNYTENNNIGNVLPIGVKTNYHNRIGFAVDLDNEYVHIIHNNIHRAYKFSTSYKNWRFVARCTQSEGASDIVTLFMNGNFAYKPPFNSKPWGHFQRITCQKAIFKTIALNNLLFFIF